MDEDLVKQWDLIRDSLDKLLNNEAVKNSIAAENQVFQKFNKKIHKAEKFTIQQRQQNLFSKRIYPININKIQ